MLRLSTSTELVERVSTLSNQSRKSSVQKGLTILQRRYSNLEANHWCKLEKIWIMTRATVFIAFTLVFTQLVRSQWSFSQNPHRRRQRQDFVFPGEEDNYFNPAPPPRPQSIQSNFGGQNNFGQPPQFNTNFFVQKPPPYKPAPPSFQQQQQQGFNPQQQGFQANRFSGRASEKSKLNHRFCYSCDLTNHCPCIQSVTNTRNWLRRKSRSARSRSVHLQQTS